MGSQLFQQHFLSKHNVALSGQSETDLYYTSSDIRKTVKYLVPCWASFTMGFVFINKAL